MTILGSGTSAGVPMIGCGCAVCTSDDPRDRRTRPSVMLRWPDPPRNQGPREQGPRGFDQSRDSRGDEHAGFNADQSGVRQVIIDAAPDLREQCLRERLSRLDALLFTHSHADHIFGLDDLRRFNAVMKTPIDIYAERPVLDELGRTFGYIFEPHKNVNQSWVAQLIATPVEAGAAFDLHGARWTPLRLMHGRLPILGYRVDHGDAAFAYCTDVSTIPPETYPLLEGLDVLVIDGLRPRHHPTHLTVDQAVEVAERVRPGRTYLTHIAHDVSHGALLAMLPAGVEPAYDGLRVAVGAAVAGSRGGGG